MSRDWLLLPSLARFDDAALLAGRLVTGVFLIDGVWDNVTSAERMAEFVGFLSSAGFPAPHLSAPFSVYTQLLFGILLIPGLLTRWAGIGIAVTFVVGYLGVHAGQTLREGWPALALIVIGLIFATRGGGRISLDRLMEHRG
jgi:putative oxidoreductase